MYPLLICSVMTLAVECYFYFRGVLSNLPQLFLKLESSLQAACWEQAVKICRQDTGAAAQIAAQGLEHQPAGSLPGHGGSGGLTCSQIA